MKFNISVNTTAMVTTFQYTTSIQANHIKFAILIILQLLSIPCFLWIFYQFACQRRLRQSLYHHVILLLLIISFLFVTIALPLTQAYMYTSYVYPANHTFCSLWNWIHYSLNMINLFLMAFASIEQNLLIFHSWLFRNKGGKIFLHYCPFIFCLFYPPIFYIGAIFIYKCKSRYNYSELLCKWPCYFYDQTWKNIDLFFNNYTPLFSILIFCLIIYVRVLIQKRTMKQKGFKWRCDKKFILQLWPISSLYLGMWMPLQLSGLINLYWNPTFLLKAQIDYIYLFPYLIHLIYPFMVLIIYHDEMLSFKQRVAVS